MDKFIIVVQPKTQEELASMGFTYTKTTLNGKTVYAFANTEGLQKYLAEKYHIEMPKFSNENTKNKKAGKRINNNTVFL